MGSVFFGVMAYIAIQFAIGAWMSRRVVSHADYVLAGRSLGPVLVSFSVFATWFGAEALVSNSGTVYKEGLSGSTSDPVGYAAGLILAGVLIAVPLWRRKLTTFADLFRERYSPGVEKLVVLVLLPGSVFWAAAQIRAFGEIMGSTAGLDVTTAVVVAAILVVAYTALGGLLADTWTDLIQGLAIILGLVVLVGVVAAQGGAGAGLAKVDPVKMQFFTLGEGGLLAKVEGLAIAICGTVVAVELISRMLGARSAQVAAAGTVIGGAMYLAFGFIPVFLGLVGAGLVPNLESADQIVPKLAETYLPGLLYIVFAGAVISAILSTVDSALLASSAQVSNNLVDRLRPGITDRGKLIAARVTLVLLAIVAYAFAATAGNVKELVSMASAAGSAGVFVTVLFALFTRFGGPVSAYAAIVAGAVVWAGGTYMGWPAPYIAGLAAAFAVYVAAGIAFPSRESVGRVTPDLSRG
ncbi:MAG: sodium:solute symporter family protein [Hyphomicrobiaceae bacterium]